jgi:hypothetical protein
MGAITERRKKDGGKSYLAQVKIVRGGEIVHRENRTFERRQAAAAWLEKREGELRAPGGLERARAESPSLAMVIDQYVAEYGGKMGNTKAQVLRSIKATDFGQKPITAIASADIVTFLRSGAPGLGVRCGPVRGQGRDHGREAPENNWQVSTAPSTPDPGRVGRDHGAFC